MAGPKPQARFTCCHFHLKHVNKWFLEAERAWFSFRKVHLVIPQTQEDLSAKSRALKLLPVEVIHMKV